MKNFWNKLTTRDERGFTLIELLVVIAIIGVLAALVLAALGSAQKGSRDSRRKSDLQQYKTALAQYNSDLNDYPSSGNITSATAAAPAGASGPCSAAMGPYLSRCVVPPNSTYPYTYVYGTANSYCMVTQLERTTAVGFEVTPTYSGNPLGAPTAAAVDTGASCNASG